MRRPYGALCGGQEFLGAVRARGHDVEDFGRRAVLLRAAGLEPGRGGRPRGQRLCQGRAAATADGIRGGSAEADLDIAGGECGIRPHPEEGAKAPVSKDEGKDCRPRPSRRAFGAPQDEESGTRTEACNATTRSKKSA